MFRVPGFPCLPAVVASLTLESPAKLNLYLAVDGLRPDGYHRIHTVFERISLSDTITLSPRHDAAVRLRCATKGIPLDGRNLCFKAALRLKEHCGVSAGCDITLVKRIPHGSGMGGGSGDAATTLRGLCRLWRLKISAAELSAIGAGIGSDVPFFLAGSRFAEGTGRGERIRPLGARGPALHHVIVVPRIHSSTKEIYAQWDRQAAVTSSPGGLTRPTSDVTMIFSALKRRDVRSLCGLLRNDLERVTGNMYPAVIKAKKQLSQEPGVAGTLMTGSGSAVFAVFETKKAALACFRRLSKGSNRVFYAETA